MSNQVSSKLLKKVSLIAIGIATMTQPVYANISEQDIQTFAKNITQAANQRNINQIANLVDDNVLISLSRNGKTTTLNKDSYLNLLQNNWSDASQYQYIMTINDVVISGNQAKANIQTVENIIKQGKLAKLTTTSRVTFAMPSSGVVLVRAVSQLTIE